MISTLIRHSDLSSRQSSHSCLSRLLGLCLLRLLRDVCRDLREKFIGDKCIDAWVLFVIFVTGFSSQSFPPAFVFCIRVACEKERQLVFLAFVSEFLFFSLFFFCKGRRRRRRRRNKTKKPKTTKKKKQDEQESGFRFEVWRRGLARQNRCPSPPSLYF